MAKFWTLVYVAFSAACVVQAIEPAAFVLIGDSTTALFGGWGDGFCGNASIGTPSSLAPNTFCLNAGRSGATTGTYRADGYWDSSMEVIKSQVAQGKRTYVTMSFGHNDQKIAPPESMGANLTVMVQELRAVGAEPVLVASMTRRIFLTNGTVDDLLKDWAAETILISEQEGTHLLDLHGASIKYVEAIGPEASYRLNLSPTDYTHINDNGSIVFGRMAANLMAESYRPRPLPIIPNFALTYNITHGIPSY